MALHTPSNLYAGAAATFNASPYTNFAINMMAKKQAKDDALDSYYRDLNKSINSAGVRTQDIPGFMEKTNTLQNYWQQNRDAIKNPRIDNGKSQTEYNSRYQDIQSYINSSKQEELKKQPFVKTISDPTKRDFVTDKMMQAIALHDLPLTDPNRQSFDITKYDFNPKELSPEEFQKFNEGIGKGISQDKTDVSAIPDPTNRFYQIETTSQRYSPEKLKAIGDEAKNAYDGSVAYTFEKNHPFKDFKTKHEQEFNRLNDIHKQVYGADINDGEDLYAATILSKKLEPTIASKRIEDRKYIDDYNFSQQKQLKGIEFGYQKALSQWKKDNGIGEGQNADDNFYNLYNSIKNKPKRTTSTGKEAVLFNDLNGDEQNVVRSFLNDKDKNVGNDRLILHTDSSGNIGVYKVEKDADGSQNIKFNQERLLTTLPEIGTNIRANKPLGVKIAKEALSGNSNEAKTQNTQSDSYSRAELKKAGWSDKQIEIAVKAGKIKVND